MDLNFDPKYFEHRKVKRLLGLLPKGSEVLPIRLWAYYALAYPGGDGRLSDHSSEEIESIAGWWGTPGSMVQAMVKVGFLDLKDGVYSLHNWLKRQGHLRALKQRSEAMNAARWKKLRESKGVLVGVHEGVLLPTQLSHSLSNAKEREKKKRDFRKETGI